MSRFFFLKLADWVPRTVVLKLEDDLLRRGIFLYLEKYFRKSELEKIVFSNLQSISGCFRGKKLLQSISKRKKILTRWCLPFPDSVLQMGEIWCLKKRWQIRTIFMDFQAKKFSDVRDEIRRSQRVANFFRHTTVQTVFWMFPSCQFPSVFCCCGMFNACIFSSPIGLLWASETAFWNRWRIFNTTHAHLTV